MLQSFKNIYETSQSGTRKTKTFTVFYYGLVSEGFLPIFSAIQCSVFKNLIQRFLQKNDACYFNSTASLTSLNPHIMLGFCPFLLSAPVYWHFFERNKTLGNMKRDFFLSPEGFQQTILMTSK